MRINTLTKPSGKSGRNWRGDGIGNSQCAVRHAPGSVAPNGKRPQAA
jgi:hypothetical protein